MGFYNACGGFRFSLNKKGVKKVTFKGKNGEDLVGKLKISFVNGKVNTEILEGENEVVLEAPAGEYFEPGVLYYFVLAPTVLSNGFTVKAETYTEEATFSYDSSVTIEASNFKSKKLMDTGLTWTQKTDNIPVEDANFKAYLVENFDNNHDGEISYVEAYAIKSLVIDNKNIESLAGIEHMICLTTLNCEFNQLTSIDLSSNTSLNSFYCGGNQLTSLDVSNNTALINLSFYNNQLTSIDLSNNMALKDLGCSENQLTSLDLSNNTALTSLSCGRNQLTSIDVSNSAELKALKCEENQLTSLDVSNNTALTTLAFFNNQLTSIDLSNNTALVTLYCDNNQLTTIDLSNNTELKDLDCSDNQLTSLDLSNNTELIWLYCYNNQLTTLDVSNNTSLEHLDCSPMDDVLISLYISQDQVIPNVTTDRNSDYISEETQIVVVSGGDNPIGDLPVPEIVDLGLSVKWASSNLEEAGGYFSWGEIYEKGSYFWRTYKWGDGSEGPTESSLIAPVTKYNTNASFGSIDNKTTLDPADDAAHMRLGDKWRIPTYDEWVELINNCDWEYTSEGILVTSRLNGNSICLEISSGNYGRDPSSYEDGFARYWSSSLDVDCPTQAWRLTVRPDEDFDEPVYLTTDLRAAGLAIRPVYAE
jgi:Leucine-rich repeat (LRR) protein